MDSREIRWWIWDTRYEDGDVPGWYEAENGDVREPFAMSRGRRVDRYYGKIDAEMWRLLLYEIGA